MKKCHISFYPHLCYIFWIYPEIARKFTFIDIFTLHFVYIFMRNLWKLPFAKPIYFCYGIYWLNKCIHMTKGLTDIGQDQSICKNSDMSVYRLISLWRCLKKFKTDSYDVNQLFLHVHVSFSPNWRNSAHQSRLT